mmetsp:Transcript_34050/g.74907  ORF Transcript_34050/g.74907 Transcript_34050/m.74907 type:complete len:152 (-) Transcript_34050:907-1362(-)
MVPWYTHMKQIIQEVSRVRSGSGRVVGMNDTTVTMVLIPLELSIRAAPCGASSVGPLVSSLHVGTSNHLFLQEQYIRIVLDRLLQEAAEIAKLLINLLQSTLDWDLNNILLLLLLLLLVLRRFLYTTKSLHGTTALLGLEEAKDMLTRTRR